MDKKITWAQTSDRWVPGVGFPKKGKTVVCDEERAASYIAQGLAVDAKAKRKKGDDE